MQYGDARNSMILEGRQQRMPQTSSPAAPVVVWQRLGFDLFETRAFAILGWPLASAHLLVQVLAGFGPCAETTMNRPGARRGCEGRRTRCELDQGTEGFCRRPRPEA